MSDEDDIFISDDEETYDFEYDDEDEELEEGESGGSGNVGAEGSEVDLENKYYNGKSLKEDDPAAALEQYLSVIHSEKSPSEWGFKALKQAIKVSFARNRPEDVMKYLEELFARQNSVSKGYFDSSLLKLFDAISKTDDSEYLNRVCDLFIARLSNSQDNNRPDRLVLKTHLKKAALLIQKGEYSKAEAILKDLEQLCINLSISSATKDRFNLGLGDNTSSVLMEVYASEIQLYTETNNYKKLKQLCSKALRVNTAILHPKIVGSLKECSGKMNMRERRWEKARQDFFESFRNYDEAGSLQRIQVLKYLVLASLLSESEINPFESQETRHYKTHSQLQLYIQLVDVFQESAVQTYNQLLKDYDAEITSDPFITQFIGDLSHIIRSKALINLLRPYRKVSLEFLCRSIGMESETQEFKQLLLSLLTAGRIFNAKLDLTTRMISLADPVIDAKTQRDQISINKTTKERQETAAILKRPPGSPPFGAEKGNAAAALPENMPACRISPEESLFPSFTARYLDDARLKKFSKSPLTADLSMRNQQVIPTPEAETPNVAVVLTPGSLFQPSSRPMESKSRNQEIRGGKRRTRAGLMAHIRHKSQLIGWFFALVSAEPVQNNEKLSQKEQVEQEQREPGGTQPMTVDGKPATGQGEPIVEMQTLSMVDYVNNRIWSGKNEMLQHWNASLAVAVRKVWTLLGMEDAREASSLLEVLINKWRVKRQDWVRS